MQQPRQGEVRACLLKCATLELVNTSEFLPQELYRRLESNMEIQKMTISFPFLFSLYREFYLYPGYDCNDLNVCFMYFEDSVF